MPFGIHRHLALAGALAACGELSRHPSAGSDGGPPDAAPGDAGVIDVDAGPTSDRRSCLEGLCTFDNFACINGECRYKCPSGQTFWCSSDEFCTPLEYCASRVASTCAERLCNAEQRCVSDHCVASTSKRCATDAACDDTEQCDPVEGTCFGRPPCSEDGSCAVGTLGALCNGPLGTPRVYPLPPWLCLIGFCESDAHCPAALKCLDIGSVASGVGRCR